MPTGVYKRSEKLKNQISNTLKQKWKIGLVKVNSGNFKKGDIPWNKEYGDYMIGEKNHFFGKQHTKKTKKKISNSKKGQKIDYPKNRKGHITTQKTKEKIGKANTGNNNGMWNGGTSFLPYPPTWTQTLKQSIRQRDNFTCQICGIKQEKYNNTFDVHHIDYNKKNCNPDNLISLCRSCHFKTNLNRKKWIEYFKEVKKC